MALTTEVSSFEAQHGVSHLSWLEKENKHGNT
jgi:hypothetical protein